MTTRAHDEPAEGFLDEKFASFRETRRRKKMPDVLEPTRRATTRTASAIAALVEGLEDDTRPGQREEPPAAPTPDEPAPAAATPVAAVEPEAPAADSTRAFVRDHALLEAAPEAPAPADDIDGSCSDPEFARFRAQRKPSSASHKKPRREGTPASGVHRKAGGEVDGRCSDPEFEKFRAERKPASGAHRKTARHTTTPLEPTPRDATPRGGIPVPAPDPTPVLASERPAEPALARLRAGEPQSPPAPSAAPASDVAGAADDGLFFGTSTLQRSMLRARVLSDRASDEAPLEAPSEDGEHARRRAPPPPLPERPRE